MTGTSPETPLDNLAEEVEPTPAPDPEEYEPDQPVSEDTGTVYDEAGETATTPRDLEVTEDDEE